MIRVVRVCRGEGGGRYGVVRMRVARVRVRVWVCSDEGEGEGVGW